MPSLILDISQLVAWLVAGVGVVFGVFRGLKEMRLSREARQTEQRWRRADLARQLLERLEGDEAVLAAFRMTDYDKGEIDVQGRFTATRQEVKTALTVGPLKPVSKETQIRDSFHSLFSHLEHLEHYIRINLIFFEDVQYPLEYWMRNLLADWRTVSKNLDAYNFPLARRFIERFQPN